MAFRVEISPSALADAEVAFLWMQKEYPDQADEWFNGLLEVIFSLENFPKRCQLAPESRDIGREISQLIYKKYRILFGVADDTVQIFRIRHTAHNWLSPDDL